MLFLFLYTLNQVSVLVGEPAAENLDKVDKVPDAEQSGRQQVENARADLADIEAMNAEAAKEFLAYLQTDRAATVFESVGFTAL